MYGAFPKWPPYAHPLKADAAVFMTQALATAVTAIIHPSSHLSNLVFTHLFISRTSIHPPVCTHLSTHLAVFPSVFSFSLSPSHLPVISIHSTSQQTFYHDFTKST